MRLPVALSMIVVSARPVRSSIRATTTAQSAGASRLDLITRTLGIIMRPIGRMIMTGVTEQEQCSGYRRLVLEVSPDGRMRLLPCKPLANIGFDVWFPPLVHIHRRTRFSCGLRPLGCRYAREQVDSSLRTHRRTGSLDSRPRRREASPADGGVCRSR